MKTFKDYMLDGLQTNVLLVMGFAFAVLFATTSGVSWWDVLLIAVVFTLLDAVRYGANKFWDRQRAKREARR